MRNLLFSLACLAIAFFVLLSIDLYLALLFVGSIILLLIDVYIAAQFSEAALAKGYSGQRFFWLCLLTTFAGYLLVIALPDRGNAQQVLPDELPDL